MVVGTRGYVRMVFVYLKVSKLPEYDRLFNSPGISLEPTSVAGGGTIIVGPVGLDLLSKEGNASNGAASEEAKTKCSNIAKTTTLN